MKADGSVIIDTEFKTDGADVGINELKTVLNSLITSIKGLTKTMTSAFSGISDNAARSAKDMFQVSDSAKATEQAMSATKRSMDSLSNSKIPTEEFAEITKAVEKAQLSLDKFLERKQKMDATGADQNSRSYKSLQYDIEQARNSLQAMEVDQQNLIDEGAAYVNEWSNATQEAEALQRQMDAIVFTNNNLPSPSNLHDTGDFDIFGNAVDMSIMKIEELGVESNNVLGQIAASTDQAAEGTGWWDNAMQSVLGTLRNGKDRMVQWYEGTGMAQNALHLLMNTVSDIPQIANMGFGALQSAVAGSGTSIVSLQEEVDRFTDALHYAEQAGYALGDAPYDEAYRGLAQARQKANEYKKSLEGTDRVQKKVKKSSDGMGKSLKKTNDIVNPLSKSIFKLGNMFKMMLTRMVMRQVITGVREGFENLAIYSDKVNHSISAIISSLTMFKNSVAAAFSPLLNVVSPILSGFIKQLAEANNFLSQLFASMSGKSSYIKAVEVQEDYAAGLDKTNEKLKEEQKQLKKVSYSFDELIQRQENATKGSREEGYTGPDPKDMFDTIEVENDVKSMADTIKKVLSDLFSPFKDSWDKYGNYAVTSAKNAFNSLKALAKDVGASFLQVWKDEGYGEKISSNLIITFGNLAQTVANLADRFRLAWNEGERGTSILRHVGDIVVTITDVFKKASESIKDWSSKLDFAPLLKSFDNVLAKLNPVVKLVGELLLWLLNNMLLPLSKWAIEQAIPAVLDLIAAGLDFLSSIIDALKPLASWLWESFLKPFGEWTGKVIVSAIEKVTDVLTSFSDWIDDNQEKVELITIAIGSFFLAWKFVEFVKGVGKMISVLPTLVGKLGTLLGSVDPIVIAIAAIIALIAILAKNWDAMTPTEKMVAGVLAAAAALAALAIAAGAVTGPIGAALTAGAIVTGIAAAAIAINAGNRKSAMSGGGGSSGFSTSSVSPYASIPYNPPALATGTVVPPRAEFLALLGDNPREPEIVAPESAIEQAVERVIARNGGFGSQSGEAVMEIDGYRFGRLIYKFGNMEKERVGLRMVEKNG